MKKIILFLFLVFGFIFTFAGGANARYYGPYWEKTEINVYVPSGERYSNTMEHAFQKWQKVSKNKLKFNFVEESKADIVVEFVDKIGDNDNQIAEFFINIGNNGIKNAKIDVIKNEKNTHSADMMFTTMLHEIGCVLGMRPSNRAIGIMHTPIDEKQDFTNHDVMKLYMLYHWPIISADAFNY